PMTIASGMRFGPYEIVSALGAGGMGEVYKARDTRLDRTVAIKILPSELGRTGASGRRRRQFSDLASERARSPTSLGLPAVSGTFACQFSPDGRQLVYVQSLSPSLLFAEWQVAVCAAELREHLSSSCRCSGASV